VAQFCIHCGAALSGPFCGSCGKSASGAPPAAQPVPSPAPYAPPPPKSGGAGKFLLIVVAVLGLLGVMTVAGVAYGIHQVRGLLATWVGAPGAAHSRPTLPFGGQACSLLSAEEAGQILNITITRITAINDGGRAGCAYFTTAAAFARLQQRAEQEARRETAEANQQPSSNPQTLPELLQHTKELEGVVKSLALSEAAQNGRVFSFNVDPSSGSANWNATRTAMKLVPGFEDISGVGDRAMVGSFGHALYVLKGSTIVQLDLTFVPDSRTTGVQLARRIAAHL
jgi:hypothetical protein